MRERFLFWKNENFKLQCIFDSQSSRTGSQPVFYLRAFFNWTGVIGELSLDSRKLGLFGCTSHSHRCLANICWGRHCCCSAHRWIQGRHRRGASLTIYSVIWFCHICLMNGNVLAPGKREIEAFVITEWSKDHFYLLKPTRCWNIFNCPGKNTFFPIERQQLILLERKVRKKKTMAGKIHDQQAA